MSGCVWLSSILSTSQGYTFQDNLTSSANLGLTLHWWSFYYCATALTTRPGDFDIDDPKRHILEKLLNQTVASGLEA
jgi:hypothetical protein